MTANSQSLVSINPNTAQQGTIITATITGALTTFMNSSGPQDIYLQMGATTIPTDWWTINVQSDTQCSVDFNIPGGAPIGIYDLYLSYWDGIFPFATLVPLTLPGSFTVGNPDGYIEGTVYNDLNQNGVNDAGDVPLSGYTVTINPGSISTNSDVNGNYSVAAMNGNYTVTYSGNSTNQLIVVPGNPASHAVVINSANSTGNDFPVIAGINYTYPDSAYQGQAIDVTVSGKGFFIVGPGANGNILSARLTKNPTQINANSANITVVDSNTAIIHFVVPSNATLGVYNLFLQINAGSYLGNHYLNNSFTVVPAPLFMNGIIFFDADSNGVKGPLENGISGAMVSLSPDSTFGFSDINGDYSLGTVPGTHTITWVAQSPQETLSPGSPASYTATVATTTSGYDFGLVNNNPMYAAEIDIHTCWAGCVHPNCFAFNITNTGTTAYDGYVYFVIDSNMIYVSQNQYCYQSPAPDSIIGDTIFWNFANLQPGASKTFSANISTPVGGVTINWSATVVSFNQSGAPAYVASDFGSHVVNCSMDPNEKSVVPAGILPQHYTLMSDTLAYTILFQNTGTDTAYTVVIRDTIDSNLDLNTLRLEVASHSVITEVSMLTRVAKFTFNNILLVDSNMNEPLSHGFVRYTIQPEAGLPANTVVYNEAGIYFDFNLPVITNQTFNTLVYVLPVGISENALPASGAVVIPNPFNEKARLVFDNKNRGLMHVQIYSVNGQLIIDKLFRESEIVFTNRMFESGMYMYRLVSEQGKTVTGRFVVE